MMSRTLCGTICSDLRLPAYCHMQSLLVSFHCHLLLVEIPLEGEHLYPYTFSPVQEDKCHALQGSPCMPRDTYCHKSQEDIEDISKIRLD